MSLIEVYEKSIHRELEECMFCHDEIDNQGVAFLEHVEDSPTCQVQYENWMVNLDLDRPGGA